MADEIFWADQIAKAVIGAKKKKTYTVAAGITPSGTVHIGNFREMITADLVVRALRSLGKTVRFIYSWDDYDRLRKVPANVPKADELKKFMGFPIVDVPDTFGCHKNYAEHMEREVADALPLTGIRPEFIFQSQMYRSCKYADDIRTCMNAREKIREALNKFREEPLPPTWYPLNVFCEKCGTDEGRVREYDGEYTVNYSCTCGHTGTVNFKKKGIVKLPWRVDWPMRWHYEKVDFEPGGKDHSAPGGSRDTGSLVIKAVYNEEPPVYQMYDFVIPKGGGAKLSKSLGNVIRLVDVLEVYLPELVRFLFAGTKPAKEFSIAMDDEIFKVYEDFYKVERIFYGAEKSQRSAHWKRVYEMSMPGKPAAKMLIQPSFRHCAEMISTYGEPEDAIKYVKGKVSAADKERYLAILRCAKNWVEKYAPDQYRFKLNSEVPVVELDDEEKSAIGELADKLGQTKTEEQVVDLFTTTLKKHGLEPKDFYKKIYTILIGKERGPRLAPMIISLGKENIVKLLKQV